MKSLLGTTCRALAAGFLICLPPALLAQSTSFTYQGRLSQSGEAADGRFDFEVQLFDGPDAPANPIGKDILVERVQVTEGLFVLNLDFGGGVFTGEPRYLEIKVRPNRGLLDWVTLSEIYFINLTAYFIL